MTSWLTGLLALLLTCILSSVSWSMEAHEAQDGDSHNPDVTAQIAKAIGSFQLCNSDSSAIIQFQFGGQLLTSWRSADKGGDISRKHTLSVQARRVEPAVTVRLPEELMSFRLRLSTAPGSLELMDLYFNYGDSKHLQIRTGQYKVPFTRYRIQSFGRLTFVDWAIVSKYFGAERQMGFSIHNGFERPPRWAYECGLFSGVNARASYAVGLAKIYGEDAANSSDLANPGPSAEIHPELVVHVSYNEDDIDVSSDSDDRGGYFRYSLGGSLAWDFDPSEFHDLALRVAPELLLKGHSTSAMCVAYAGFVGMDNSQRTRLAMTGLLAQASVRLSNRYEVSLRYAVVDFDDYLVDVAYERGQALIALAQEHLNDAVISRENLDEIVGQYKSAGKILKEQELTAGLNVYFMGHSLKLQSDISWLRHSVREGDSLNDITARSQFQIAF